MDTAKSPDTKTCQCKSVILNNRDIYICLKKNHHIRMTPKTISKFPDILIILHSLQENEGQVSKRVFNIGVLQ